MNGPYGDAHAANSDRQRIPEQQRPAVQHFYVDTLEQAELPQAPGFGRVKQRPVDAGNSRDTADRQPIQGQGLAHLHLRAIIKCGLPWEAKQVASETKSSEFTIGRYRWAG